MRKYYARRVNFQALPLRPIRIHARRGRKRFRGGAVRMGRTKKKAPRKEGLRRSAQPAAARGKHADGAYFFSSFTRYTSTAVVASDSTLA
ncbi:MAG: hypothetical protein ACN6P8_12545, partial [Achromobacter piechaudii]